ncbi:hypothetical protein Tco_1005577 [Tanacetum coccineum]|uniref:Uncharacterized protein n=1 Tax=Tanacetum coccineum TaxID=301880 RepID=A0ABQ5FGC9_9ASTR
MRIKVFADSEVDETSKVGRVDCILDSVLGLLLSIKFLKGFIVVLSVIWALYIKMLRYGLRKVPESTQEWIADFRYLEDLLKPLLKSAWTEKDQIDNFLKERRFYTSAGNPVKEILLKLNLPDHRKLKDGGE